MMETVLLKRRSISTRLHGVLQRRFVALDDLVVIVFATGPKVRGFKPGRGR
jgi:hypothetical protein